MADRQAAWESRVSHAASGGRLADRSRPRGDLRPPAGRPSRLLFEQPVTVKHAQKAIGRTYPVANELVAEFERLGLLRETTGGSRNCVFEYAPYVQIFGELRP